MKKIFGVLSLIAILTVTFTLQANTSQEVNKQGVVFDVGDSVSVAVAVVDTAVFEPSLIVHRNFEVIQGNFETQINLASFVDLRIDYGIRGEGAKFKNNQDNSSNYKNSQRNNGAGNGYNGLYKPVGWNS
jgi:hypothetical protein